MTRRLALFAGATALLVVPRLTVVAQSFPSNDPVIKRMWALGMDSSQTYELAQVLMDSIGPRLTGTPGIKAGQDWLVKTYASWGVDARNEQWGTWLGWRRGHAHIDLIKPRARALEATIFGRSPGTDGKDVTGTTIIVPMMTDSSQFVNWLPNVKGKFVLIFPAYPSCRPEDDWALNATPESRAHMDTVMVRLTRNPFRGLRAAALRGAVGAAGLDARLDAAGAAGIIYSYLYGGLWGTYSVGDVYPTRTQRAPNIAMSCEDYGLLYRLTERNQGPLLRVNAVGELLGDMPQFNTIATIKGSEKPAEYVMLSAHFDSYDGASGATDNGTGTITMLEAARLLRTAYPRPKRTILVGHWSGEEQGLKGSVAWAADHPEVVDGLAAFLNYDSGTARMQYIDGAGLPDAGEHIQRWLMQLPDRFRAQLKYAGVGTPARGGSDNASFACYGAPAINLVDAPSADWDSNTHHTNRDSFDTIVFDDLNGNATIIAMLAYLASEDPTLIKRDRIDLADARSQNQHLSAQDSVLDAAVSPRAALSRALYPTPAGGRGGPPPAWPSCRTPMRAYPSPEK